MAASMDKLLNEIVTRAASEIAGAVRSNIADEVHRAVKAQTASVPAAPAVRAARQVSRKPSVARVPAVPAKRVAKGGRRSSEQVAKDDARLLDYVASHPGQRSEQIQKGVGLRKVNVASGLQRLREAGKIEMKGVKRGATYTAR